MALKKLEKRVYLVWSLFALLLAPVLAVVAGGLLYVYTGSTLIVAAVFILSAAAGLFYVSKLYRSWGFELRDDHLYLEHGVFRKVYSMVPYVRVQHVDTQRGVIDRVAGLSTLVVYTAGSRGADVAIPGLLPGDAEDIQEKLRDVAIRSEDRDAV